MNSDWISKCILCIQSTTCRNHTFWHLVCLRALVQFSLIISLFCCVSRLIDPHKHPFYLLLNFGFKSPTIDVEFGMPTHNRTHALSKRVKMRIVESIFEDCGRLTAFDGSGDVERVEYSTDWNICELFGLYEGISSVVSRNIADFRWYARIYENISVRCDVAATKCLCFGNYILHFQVAVCSTIHEHFTHFNLPPLLLCSALCVAFFALFSKPRHFVITSDITC